MNLEKKLSKLSLLEDFYFFETINSTNLFGLSLAKEKVQKTTLILAEEQTAGIGRFGRSWNSQKNKGLWFTLVFPKIEDEKKPLLSMLFASCLVNVLKEKSVFASVKWPNDVFLNRKKICGILAQTVSNFPSIVVGTGINVNHENFPGDLPNASSLFLETGKFWNKNDLLFEFLAELETNLKFSEEKWLQDWQTNCSFLGEKVSVFLSEKIFEGVFEGVTENGNLILKQENGERSFFSAGEVSLKNC
ncbi:biotin--[acetyl-CoA-carboxylase] ligase [bacterium]|nr:biotin--[acetyl-CoA-carboxylase] ligase [bacterium]